MKWHALRPLWLALGVVALALIARVFLVPDDFGVHGRNFTYGFYRLGNVQEWREFPVSYRGREYCATCHADNVHSIADSPHAAIQCENCHGPARGHPAEIATLPVDHSRELCLRCHADLEYPGGGRAAIPGINPERHKRRFECSECHNPHDPREDA